MLPGHGGRGPGAAPSRARLAGAAGWAVPLPAGWAWLPCCVGTAAREGAHPGVLGQEPMLGSPRPVGQHGGCQEPGGVGQPAG